MADAVYVYAIKEFPDDDLLWRIGWIGGAGYNTSVPSDPHFDLRAGPSIFASKATRPARRLRRATALWAILHAKSGALL